MFPFVYGDVTIFSCTTIDGDTEVCIRSDIFIILYDGSIQAWCATQLDDDRRMKKLGYCGAGCPREDEDVWVTDDTLTVTYH